MFSVKSQPLVRLSKDKLFIAFESLSDLIDTIYYEDDDLFIDLKALKNFQYYLGIQDGVKTKYEIPRKSLLSQNISVFNKAEVQNAILVRFHSYELATFFFIKNFFPTKFILKDYQLEGITWLKSKNKRLLADDMGLGKTAQALTAAVELFLEHKIKRVVIICPRSLMQNWVDEINIWAKSFKSFDVHSNGSTNDLWKGILNHAHFFIINYDQTRNLSNEFIANPPDLVIADEAHKLRKQSSQIHKSVKNLSKLSKHFWALTGTPIEKDTNDLINLMRVISPDSMPKNSNKLSDGALKGLVKKDFLRRLKVDVMSELGEAKEQTYYLKLQNSQQTKYDHIRKTMFLDLSSQNALKYFNDLRSICDIYDGGGAKLEFAMDLIEKISASSEKVIIFSYKLDPLYALKNLIDKKYSKAKSLIYEGLMDSSSRAMAIKDFKQNNEITCLLCSGKIAGEGLNLTEANNVIFLNEWWNPSTNDQARDRVLRIGQTKKVNIYNLRTKNTVEESLEYILNSKTKITDNVIEKMIRH